jgi:hypothetical protein
MGSVSSRPAAAASAGSNGANDSGNRDEKRRIDARRKKEQQEAEQYRLQLAKYGVLLPPAFGVGRVPLGLSTFERLVSTTSTTGACPSEYGYLHHTDASYRLVNDYVSVFISNPLESFSLLMFFARFSCIRDFG